MKDLHSYLKPFLVIDNNKIDIQKSVACFQKHLLAYETGQQTDQARIAASVDSIYDRFKGKCLTKDMLISYVYADLEVSPEYFSNIATAVVMYVKSHTGAKGSLFGLKMGAGFFRWSDKQE